MFKLIIILTIFALVCCFFSMAALQIAGGIISILTVILGIMIHYWYITVAVIFLTYLLKK